MSGSDLVCADQNAMADNHKLIEVEFPPLPLSAIEGDAIGADAVLRAQLSHAGTNLASVRLLCEAGR